MKKTALFLLLLLAATSLWSQDDTVANRFREQYARLGKEYTQWPDNVVNLMEMADFFSNPDNPHYNLPLAAGYAKRAEAIYTLWVPDKKKYREVQKFIRKGITIPVIRQKRKDIEAQAVLYVRSHVPQMNEAEASAFIEAFADNDEIVKRLHSKVLADEYERVRHENTLGAYYAFVQAHPNTSEADSAEQALSRLAPSYYSQFETEEAVDAAAAPFAASAVMQYAAMKQKSRLAYLAVCRKNTVEAYSNYLERFPRGDYYLEALERLQLLRNADYRMLSTPEELADFAEANSDDPLADSALALLRNMVLQDHSQQAARVYLSRFPLDQEYSNVYKHYYEWYAQEGNSQPIASFMAEHPDYPFLMAVRSDMARAAVIDSVDLTKPFVESDYDTMATGLRLLTGRKASFVALQRLLQSQIAAKDWAGAKKRLQRFDICFEDVAAAEYDELSHLLSDNSAVTATLELAADQVSNVHIHPSGKTLCFTYYDQDRQAVGLARRVEGKKQQRWLFVGEIEVEGCTAPVVPYHFYDQGQKVLVGINNDIWSAQVVSDTVWQLLEHFQQPVNTQYIEQDAFMLDDGSGMLLVSDRPGGHNVQQSGSYYHGDHAPAFDIYFIPLEDSTSSGIRWGSAVNLGIGVNTPYCERSPILSRNMRTLYYVTDARGLGYGDIYRVTRQSLADWTQWSKPANMGRGVNGPFGEASLSFGVGERTVFYTSGTRSEKRNACYSFPTRHDNTSCYTQLSIRLDSVIDILNSIKLVEEWNQHIVEELPVSLVDTMMVYHLYRGMPYAFLAEANWLYIPTCLFKPNDKDEVVPQAYTYAQLKSLAEPLPLPLTQFVSATAALRPLAYKELDVLAHFMRQHPSSTIEVEVHVDGSNDDDCYRLSLERASAIRATLADCGISSDRIRLAPLGNSRYKKGAVAAPVAIRFF